MNTIDNIQETNPGFEEYMFMQLGGFKKKLQAVRVTQMVKCLPCKYGALRSSPSTTKKQKQNKTTTTKKTKLQIKN
jgi:hypothetical protein